jgi:general secretion pathway protein C
MMRDDTHAEGGSHRHLTAMILREYSPMGTRARLVLELRQRGPQVTAFLIAILLVADVGNSARALWSAAHPQTDPPALTTQRPARRAGEDAHLIVNAHVFGEVPAERLPVGDADSAPDTRLALALSGIIATQNPGEGFAILGEQGKPSHLYAAGAVVAAMSARVYRVFSDRVVLERDGELETLRLPRNTLLGIVAATDSAAPVRPQDPRDADLFDRNHPSSAQGLINTMGAEPRDVDGRLAGLVVHPPKYLQRRYGLQDGDLLTAINGVEITDPDALTDMLRTAGGSLSLTLTRDGAQQTKTVQLND